MFHKSYFIEVNSYNLLIVRLKGFSNDLEEENSLKSWLAVTVIGKFLSYITSIKVINLCCWLELMSLNFGIFSMTINFEFSNCWIFESPLLPLLALLPSLPRLEARYQGAALRKRARIITITIMLIIITNYISCHSLAYARLHI